MKYPMYSPIIESWVCNPRNFDLLGFCIVRQVLSQDEVYQIRQRIPKYFDRFGKEQRMLQPRQVLQIPELCSLAFKKKIVSSLKKAIGDPYIQWGDFQLKRNCFGGWHVDSGSESGCDYLFKSDYRFVKCGLFFQENSIKYGGGIDIRLFSHKLIYNRLPKVLKFFLIKFFLIFKKLLEHRLKIASGDFVFFDSRLAHTSSLPKNIELKDLDEKGVCNLTENNSKYILYWNACSQVSSAGFMKNTFKRSFLEEVLPKSEEIFFTDYASKRYPEDYPEYFRELMIENQLLMASPSERESKIHRKFLQDFFEIA